jgi:hypothetical protein
MTRAGMLSTVTAAALLLSVGVASAQKKDESPAPAPPAIQNAPPEKIAPDMKAGKTDAVTHKPATAADTAPDANGSASTTGQGAAAGSGKLSAEQRGKITTILKQKKVEQTHLTVSVKVGTRVPESVHSYPLPVEVAEVYPEWRSFDYILVGDEIMIIDPATHEIVAILPA